MTLIVVGWHTIPSVAHDFIIIGELGAIALTSWACGIANFTAPTASLRCWSLQCRWGCLCCYSSGGLDIKFGVFSTCPFCREHTWKIHSITTLPFSNYRHIFTLIALSIWAKANRTMFQTLTVSLAIVRLSISLWFSRIFVTFDVQDQIRLPIAMYIGEGPNGGSLVTFVTTL